MEYYLYLQSDWRVCQPSDSCSTGLESNLCPRPTAYPKYLAVRVSSLFVIPFFSYANMVSRRRGTAGAAE